MLYEDGFAALLVLIVVFFIGWLFFHFIPWALGFLFFMDHLGLWAFLLVMVILVKTLEPMES